MPILVHQRPKLEEPSPVVHLPILSPFTRRCSKAECCDHHAEHEQDQQRISARWAAAARLVRSDLLSLATAATFSSPLAGESRSSGPGAAPPSVELQRGRNNSSTNAGATDRGASHSAPREIERGCHLPSDLKCREYRGRQRQRPAAARGHSMVYGAIADCSQVAEHIPGTLGEFFWSTSSIRPGACLLQKCQMETGTSDPPDRRLKMKSTRPAVKASTTTMAVWGWNRTKIDPGRSDVLATFWSLLVQVLETKKALAGGLGVIDIPGAPSRCGSKHKLTAACVTARQLSAAQLNDAQDC